MLAVLLFWIILLCILLFLGDALNLLFCKISNIEYDLPLISSFFLGLACAGAIACTASIFTPLTQSLFLICLLISLTYWGIRRRQLFKIIKSALNSFVDLSNGGKILYLFLSFVVLYHSSSISSSFEQFLYHQQHIKWLQEHGAVNGLANLHSRFGFNSSSLSINSLLAYHPNLRISFTALNGLCMFIFSSWLIFKILKSKNTAMGLIFTITLVIISHFYAMELSSTSTDIIVNMLITYLLLCCFFEDDIKKLYLPLTISPLFCITFKEFESINIDETTFFAPKEKGQCFDREQPCSPNICRNLKLRGNSLKDGFKIKQE